jgi:hypothetical protein
MLRNRWCRPAKAEEYTFFDGPEVYTGMGVGDSMGYAFNTAWRGGDGDATETFEEYKDFGGVRMATKNTHREGGDVSIFRITSVTYDDVSDEVSALPEAVRNALAAKKASGK